jgi:hypothetical protein
MVVADLQHSEPPSRRAGHESKASRGGALSALARSIFARNLFSARNFIAVVVAVLLVLLLGVVIGAAWSSIGDAHISPAGWVAMAFGIIFTLALGIGLMALVFVSSRRGYDELGRRSETARPPDGEA